MKTSFQPEPCFQVNVFSSSILPGGDVGASYRKVKWRTPAKAHIAGNARNKLDSVNFFIEGAARFKSCRGSRWLPDSPRWDANSVLYSIVSFVSVNGLQFFGDCLACFGFRLSNRLFDRRTAAEMSRRIVGTDHQNRGDELRDQGFVSREHREPHSHPARNHRNQPRDRRCRNPVRQLHLLRLMGVWFSV